MLPELFNECCEEYTHEINRLRTAALSGIAAIRIELQKVQRQIAQIIRAIKGGI